MPNGVSVMNNIVLTGFMGTGKSTVGAALADRLNWTFVDTDTLIIDRAGMTIPQIFAQGGEPAFRAIEREACAEAAARSQHVIATGGGALIDPQNLAIMQQHGMVVCLNAPPEVIEARLGEDQNRPLAANWRELLAKRKTAYAAIPHQIDTTDKSPQHIAEEIMTLWQSFT